MLGKPELLDDVIADEDAADLRGIGGEDEGEWELGILRDLGEKKNSETWTVSKLASRPTNFEIELLIAH